MKQKDDKQIPEQRQHQLPDCLAHLGLGFATLVIRTLALSLILAYLLSIIDGLRTLGQTPFLFPFSALGQYQPKIESSANSSPLVSAFSNFVFLFNCTFPGASRLGSGIGMIAAAFWTLHEIPRECRMQRIFLSLAAGAIIGFRLMLMVSSSAVGVLGASVIFSLSICAYMNISARSKPIEPLPSAAEWN